MPREARVEHLNMLEAAGVNPFPAEPPNITHGCYDILSQFEQLEGGVVTVAGRLAAIRDHGKVIFYSLEDSVAVLQLRYQRGDGNADIFDLVRQTYDPGDIVSATGEVAKTRRGEVTVDVADFTMLSKALRDMPPQIVSPEVGRKQRYLELLTNPQAKERFRKRARMIQLMREEFLYNGFLEIETPVLDVTYGGALARPFTTHMHALDQEMYLRIANELYMKRLMCGNIGPIFEFSRNFRNEGMDRIHNPEFTAVELYKPFSDYSEMMRLAETTFEQIAVELYGTTKVPYGEQIINLKAPWRRLSVHDGFAAAYGVDARGLSDPALHQMADREQIDPKYRRPGEIILALFEKKYYSELVQPTFIVDYPRETSPLAKGHRSDPALAERFEGVIGNMKVMNGYTELNDPRDQRQRFVEEGERAKRGDLAAMPDDKDFILAMEYGFPPMGGLGIGIDRMAMILTNTQHIRDIILFPIVRSRSGQ